MSKIKEDTFAGFFEYDFNLKTRTLYIGSTSSDSDVYEVTRTEKVIKALHILENTAPDGDKPINIILNHNGGDVYEALAIYDAIKNCKNTVNITVYGKAMSSGAIVLQAGDRRIMMPNSTLMVHYGYSAAEDHSKTVEKTINENARLDRLAEDLFLDRIKEKNPKYTKGKIKKLLTFDSYITAEDALSLGLIDEIKEYGT